MVNKFVILILFLPALICCSNSKDNSYEVKTGDFIKSLSNSGHRLSDSIYTYSDSTLYQYLNGADHYYLQKGIIELSVGYLQFEKYPNAITVEIYKFKEPDSAKAVFEEREDFTERSLSGEKITASDDRGAFVFNNYYANITCGIKTDSIDILLLKETVLSMTRDCLELCKMQKSRE